ncbi:MAG TPA: hypothetical protein VK186_19780, partial [Candidatus Deferrimicrobium sp.]|nr:hypothetical protein [Candidatus Deferrimicrobium sp.]
MKSTVNKKCLPAKKSFAASVIITLLFLLVMFFGIFGQGSIKGLKHSLIAGTVLAYFTFLIFMMLYTGDVNRWRKIFFTT